MAAMSAPAAKAFSLPVRTMQPMPSSASKAEQRRAQRVHQLVVERVELRGRFSVMTATRPSVRIWMNSGVDVMEKVLM